MENERSPNWIRNSLLLTGILSVALIAICILLLDTAERTAINIITIIGTVFGLMGLGLAIYQQMQLIGVSDAINKTTSSIETKIKDIHYQINIVNGIKCVEKMESFFTNDSDAKRLHIKLNDLHSCIMECRKILEKKNENTSAIYIKLKAYDNKIVRFETDMFSSDYSINSLKAMNFSNFMVTLKRDLNQIKNIEYYI